MPNIKHIIFTLPILCSILLGQDKIIISSDTLKIPYTNCPNFGSLIGSIDHCLLHANKDRVWIKPISKGLCGSDLQYYYFELRNPEIKDVLLYHLPQNIKNKFHHKNAIPILEKNIIINVDENYRYLVLTDSLGNYIQHKICPKNKKGSLFMNSGYVFKIKEELYFSYISTYLPPQINNNNTTTFGRIPLIDVFKNGKRRLKYKDFVDAFPCNFPNTPIFWYDRQYFPDEKEQKVWYMDNYRSKLTSFSPNQNRYECYELPTQVFKNHTEWHYFDKIDSLYNGVKKYREHDKWIVNSKQEKVGLTEQEYFTILPDETPVLFRSTLIITSDTLLLEYLDSISSSQGFDITNRPLVKRIPIYHMYECIFLTTETQHKFQIVAPRGQEIRAVESSLQSITGFKMILNEDAIFEPALITWKIHPNIN